MRWNDLRKLTNVFPYGERVCSTNLPRYFLLTNPATESRRVCSPRVFSFAPSAVTISSSVAPSLSAIYNKISIRWWFAIPFRCRSICFAVFPFAMVILYTTPLHSQVCKDIICGNFYDTLILSRLGRYRQELCEESLPRSELVWGCFDSICIRD